MESPVYRWDILIPAQRYVFAVDDGAVVEFNQAGDESFDRFRRYQELKTDYPVHGMIAWPNTVLLRGPHTVVVDPGLLTQGPPLLLALAQHGLEADDVDLVLNTHHHVDHTQANIYFGSATQVVHRLERDRHGSDFRLGAVLPALRLLEGSAGEIAPGLQFVHTPGHTDGSMCVVVRIAEGRLVIAGDTVGPLPEYFERRELPTSFPGRRELLESWRKIDDLRPDILIPGHNPPMVPSGSPLAASQT